MIAESHEEAVRRVAKQHKDKYADRYRQGWKMHKRGRPLAAAFFPATQSGWQARQTYMAGPLPAQVAAWAETVADVMEMAEGETVSA